MAINGLLEHPDGCSSTGFPIKYARLLKYLKSIFHIILPSLSSLNGSGIFLIFKKRTSFLGNPVESGLAEKSNNNEVVDCGDVEMYVHYVDD